MTTLKTWWPKMCVVVSLQPWLNRYEQDPSHRTPHTGPSHCRPSQQPQQPAGFVPAERSWWLLSQLYRTSGFCGEVEDYSGSMWKPVWRGLWGWSACEKHEGCTHTYYTSLWPSQRNGYTHGHTNTRTTNLLSWGIANLGKRKRNKLKR